MVETKRGLLERDRAMAAAAAVAEKLILSHVCARQRDRHRPLRGCRAACMRHAAEGQWRRRFGLHPCLPVLELGSLAQLSRWDSLEQQRRLQGALVRGARRASRRFDRESRPRTVLEKNHEFAVAVCEYGESLV